MLADLPTPLNYWMWDVSVGACQHANALDKDICCVAGGVSVIEVPDIWCEGPTVMGVDVMVSE
jgi:hypothetical protein